MSDFDPGDGYKPCTICGTLTRNLDRICALCNGEVPTLPKRKRRTRDPFGVTRNHSQGHGWKANHES